jgi:hypothetical protein
VLRSAQDDCFVWGIDPAAGRSAAEVDEFDLADGALQKAGTEALEFVNGVGGEAANLRIRQSECLGG